MSYPPCFAVQETKVQGRTGFYSGRMAALECESNSNFAVARGLHCMCPTITPTRSHSSLILGDRYHPLCPDGTPEMSSGQQAPSPMMLTAMPYGSHCCPHSVGTLTGLWEVKLCVVSRGMAELHLNPGGCWDPSVCTSSLCFTAWTQLPGASIYLSVKVGTSFLSRPIYTRGLSQRDIKILGNIKSSIKTHESVLMPL